MVEILAKVFGGAFGSLALLFIVWALFTPAFSFLIEFEKDEEKKKTAQMRIIAQMKTIQITQIIKLTQIRKKALKRKRRSRKQQILFMIL